MSSLIFFPVSPMPPAAASGEAFGSFLKKSLFFSAGAAGAGVGSASGRAALWGSGALCSHHFTLCPLKS